MDLLLWSISLLLPSNLLEGILLLLLPDVLWLDVLLPVAVGELRAEDGSDEVSSFPTLEEAEDETEEIEDEEESEFGERVFAFLTPPCSASLETDLEFPCRFGNTILWTCCLE